VERIGVAEAPERERERETERQRDRERRGERMSWEAVERVGRQQRVRVLDDGSKTTDDEYTLMCR
jgi:hypothetical protein